MDFSELVKKRYSARAYKPDSVEDAKVGAVLEAARLAPTAANRQAFRIIVVPTKGREEDLGRIYGRPWFVQAPLVMAVCAVPGEAWVRRDGWSAAETDATIVMTHVILAAADLGLGTCWIANFDLAAAQDILGLPKGVVPIAFTPLGYPAESPEARTRRPFEEVVGFDRW